MEYRPYSTSRYTISIKGLLPVILIVLAGTRVSLAAPRPESAADRLVHIAGAQFPGLSDCETTLLKAVTTGDVAYCGPTHSDSDPVPNAKGDANRTDSLRAGLVRWLCVDQIASKLVDPKGIQVYSAYFGDMLDLSSVAVAFPLNFKKSLFQRQIDLSYSRLINFNASGSQMHGIMAENVRDDNDFNLESVTSDGEINLMEGDLGGDLLCNGANLGNPGAIALQAPLLKVGHEVFLRERTDSQGKTTPFSAQGEVILAGGDFRKLNCIGASFSNPGRIAFDAENLIVDGDVYFRAGERPFETQGTLDLAGAKINGELEILPRNTSTDWSLDLHETSAVELFDDETSWPLKDHLKLDGFVYSQIYGGTKDVEKRVDWVRRQGKDNFATQPYEHLAKVLRDEGDDEGARRVLIAMEDDRRSDETGFGRRLWSRVLWATIGYGYDTWRALWFIAALVVVGWAIFLWGGKRKWIRSTEDHPEHYEPFNPFIYSLETLLPLVDLYQAKHWVPNAKSLGGKTLRCYLWVHTILGWFLTAMLIAGVTGLVQK
jgi:hypothetical protein